MIFYVSLISLQLERIRSPYQKTMLGHFPLSTTQENIKTSRLKMRLRKLYKKENFTPEIKPMIENLPDELYKLESEHEKGEKHHVNIIKWSLMVKNAPKHILMYLEDSMKIETISELHAGAKKLKYSSNPNPYC